MSGRESLKNRFGTRFFYFSIEESFRPLNPTDFTVLIQYYDESPGTIELEYDGSDSNAPFGGAYTKSPTVVKLVGDKKWKRATFQLPKAVFAGSQNSGADFRFSLSGEQLVIGFVTLNKN